MREAKEISRRMQLREPHSKSEQGCEDSQRRPLRGTSSGKNTEKVVDGIERGIFRDVAGCEKRYQLFKKKKATEKNGGKY